MNNMEAIALVSDVVQGFLCALREDAADSELDSLLRTPLFTMSTIPQLEGVGELLAKAWLESRPSSAAARRLAIEHLVDVGKGDEAVLIENGEAPGRVGEFSASERERHARNEARSLEALKLK